MPRLIQYTLLCLMLLTSLLSSSAKAQNEPLPPPNDLNAVHRYIESLAFDSSEARAMQGFNRLLAVADPYTDNLVTLYLHHEGDVRCRWVAGQLLARMHTPGALAATTEGLTASLPLARMAAIQAVQYQRPQDGFDRLVNGLKDPAAVLRASACDELAIWGDARAVPYLMEAYDNPHNEHKGKSLFVRQRIVTALGQLGGPAVLPTLIEGMNDEDLALQQASEQAALAVTGLRYAPPGMGNPAERWQGWYENWAQIYANGQTR